MQADSWETNQWMAQLTRDLARLATNVHPGKWSAEELSRFVWSLHRGRYAAEAPLLAYVSSVVVQVPSAELPPHPPLPSLPYKVDTSRPSLRTNWTRRCEGNWCKPTRWGSPQETNKCFSRRFSRQVLASRPFSRPTIPGKK